MATLVKWMAVRRVRDSSQVMTERHTEQCRIRIDSRCVCGVSVQGIRHLFGGLGHCDAGAADDGHRLWLGIYDRLSQTSPTQAQLALGWVAGIQSYPLIFLALPAGAAGRYV